MADNDNDDRRAHQRTAVLLKLEYHQPGDMLADYITDLGDGGLFICTTVPFDVGQTIEFAISFPGLVAPVQFRGIVRWRRAAVADRDDKPAGVGIEFEFQNDTQRNAVQDILKSARQKPSDVGVAATPFRVLLVEDNAFTHDLFKHAVKKFYETLARPAPLEIIGAMDGQQGLAKLKKGGFDLAIVDYFLPVINGDDLIAEARKASPNVHIPILVVSVGGEDVREASLKAGADLYVSKPVLLKQLLVTLHMLVCQKP